MLMFVFCKYLDGTYSRIDLHKYIDNNEISVKWHYFLPFFGLVHSTLRVILYSIEVKICDASWKISFSISH